MVASVTRYILVTAVWGDSSGGCGPCRDWTALPVWELHCGAWLSGRHDTMALYAGQSNFPSHFTSLPAFITVLHSILHSSVEKMKKWVQSSEWAMGKLFCFLFSSMCSWENVSRWKLEVIRFLTLGLLRPADHFTAHLKCAAVASPQRSVNKGPDKGSGACGADLA